MQIVHSHLLLDACCVLNFCASGQLLAILKSIPVQVAVTQIVRDKELKTLQHLEDEENDSATQFEAAIAQNLLIIVDFESEEEAESFVNYAANLDDGESATGALAFHREWAMATDDKRAISFFRKETPQIQILSTLEIVKHWSEEAGVDSQTLRDALNLIRVKARYMPHKSHPLLSWWETARQ
jgi:predicted nucleic acid-binding protein